MGRTVGYTVRPYSGKSRTERNAESRKQHALAVLMEWRHVIKNRLRGILTKPESPNDLDHHDEGMLLKTKFSP